MVCEKWKNHGTGYCEGAMKLFLIQATMVSNLYLMTEFMTSGNPRIHMMISIFKAIPKNELDVTGYSGFSVLGAVRRDSKSFS